MTVVAELLLAILIAALMVRRSAQQASAGMPVGDVTYRDNAEEEEPGRSLPLTTILPVVRIPRPFGRWQSFRSNAKVREVRVVGNRATVMSLSSPPIAFTRATS